MKIRFIEKLAFEDDEEHSNSLRQIYTEAKKGEKLWIVLTIVSAILMFMIVPIAESELNNTNLLLLEIIISALFNVVILFIIPFLLIWAFFVMTPKRSPSLRDFINENIEEYNLSLRKGFNTILYFSTFSLINVGGRVFCYLSIIFNFSIDTIPLEYFFWIFTILSFLMIIWGVTHDALYVNIMNGFHAKLNFKQEIFIVYSENGDEPGKWAASLGIYMTSNRLGLKTSKEKLLKYKEIYDDRQLVRESRWGEVSRLNPFLHFYDFTLINSFEMVFSNFLAAIIEWDEDLSP